MADKNNFWIADADKEWIHDSFNWLIQAYGYPQGNLKLVELIEEFFPETFSSKPIDVNTFINDLCGLFSLDKKKFTYDLVKDVRVDDAFKSTYGEMKFKSFHRLLSQK